MPAASLFTPCLMKHCHNVSFFFFFFCFLFRCCRVCSPARAMMAATAIRHFDAYLRACACAVRHCAHGMPQRVLPRAVGTSEPRARAKRFSFRRSCSRRVKRRHVTRVKIARCSPGARDAMMLTTRNTSAWHAPAFCKRGLSEQAWLRCFYSGLMPILFSHASLSNIFATICAFRPRHFLRLPAPPDAHASRHFSLHVDLFCLFADCHFFHYFFIFTSFSSSD